MPIAQSLLPEFDHETATTRRLLECVPEGQASWKPHEKSMSLGELAAHLRNIPDWASATLKHTEVDINPPGGRPSTPSPFQSVEALLRGFDESVKQCRAMLVNATDGEMMVPWTLKDGGRPVFSLPRVGVFRAFIMNHMIHHRGQLSVYLRLCNVALPNIYGPTADTKR
jgi:uncharacterized damage-inducible protein DinB